MPFHQMSIRGIVDMVDPRDATLRLRVQGGSGHGKRWIGREVDVDATVAELAVPDANGDRQVDLRDVFPGNDIEVRFSGAVFSRKGLRARKVTHLGPPMPAGGLRGPWF